MEEIQAIKKDKLIVKRWEVVTKLGEGGMGAVFKVRDRSRFGTHCAMKVEADISDGGVLKLEARVLKTLENMECVPRLLDSGEYPKYCFIVMTLLGPDLMAHKRTGGVAKLCDQTTLRIAMATLYAIKQIHEAGWVHRDIKPGNMVTGLSGADRKNVYLIDYGMVRSFIIREGGKPSIRRARAGEQMFRGTPRYCSQNVHNLKEQGRVDDLWSWLYMLIELHQGLPWRRLTDEKQIAEAKATTDVETLLKGCPKVFFELYSYIKTLGFRDRPDYAGLWSVCYKGFRRVNGAWSCRTEWEMVEDDKRREEKRKKKEEEDAKEPKRQKTETELELEKLRVEDFTALTISADRKPGDYEKPPPLKVAKKIWPFADIANFKKRILNL